MKGKGILLPILSLPNKFGIGSFGKEAREFANFLRETEQNYWQILPLNPTTYGDSPYQSPSAYAGNPYFIDLEILKEEGLLTDEEYRDAMRSWEKIDYENLYYTRYDILRKAYQKFKNEIPNSYFKFVENHWLDDYAFFMAIKDFHGGISWNEWDIKYRDIKKAKEFKDKFSGDIEFYKFLQFKFFEQWNSLKNYCNEIGIKIIGDLPIYVAFDSADVWSAPQYFEIDDNLLPKNVAGVPPDAFTDEGQLWGNPLYDWKVMQNENFRWWLKRIEHAFLSFDAIRIDHFRGFAAYYSIPFGEKTAKNGKWVKGLGKELFLEIKKHFPNAEIIAEDLGYLDGDVRELLKFTKYPGMKILQFAFYDDNSEYLPEYYPANCAAYTGTHDNMNTKAYFDSLDENAKNRLNNTIKRKPFETKTHAFIRTVLESNADTKIIPMQDYLELSDARINTPSTLGGNWIWRLEKDYYSEKNLKKIKGYI